MFVVVFDLSHLSSDIGASLSSLVRSGGLNFPPDDRILSRMRYHFTARVAVILKEGVEAAPDARALYQLAQQMPSTETNAKLKTVGITILDVCNNAERCVVLFGNKSDGAAIALKRLTNMDEVERLHYLVSLNLSHPGVVPFELCAPLNDFLLMPRYISTLTELKPLTAERQHLLVSQVGAALRYLHEKCVAHMDVKPDNIALNHLGEFILIDIGNAAPFGTLTDVTSMFVPAGFPIIRGQLAASSRMDFCQLAMTILAKLEFSYILNRKTQRLSPNAVLEALMTLGCVVCESFVGIL